MAKGGYSIELWPLANSELEALRAFDRRRIAAAMDSQLSDDPLKITRNRKPLPGVVAGFEFDPPLRELKVGEYRVLFDVDESERVVNIRAIRRKPPGKTTAEILL